MHAFNKQVHELQRTVLLYEFILVHYSMLGIQKQERKESALKDTGSENQSNEVDPNQKIIQMVFNFIFIVSKSIVQYSYYYYYTQPYIIGF